MSRPTIILALLAVSACAARVPVTMAQMPDALADGKVSYAEFQENDTAARDSIRQLAELEVLAVGDLIVDAPEGSQNCYGPCEDDATDQVWMQEHAWQVARLQALTEEAVALAQQAPTANPMDRQASLDALNELEIIEIEGMFQHQPANCYVGFCTGDESRAGIIEALAEQTKGL